MAADGTGKIVSGGDFSPFPVSARLPPPAPPPLLLQLTSCRHSLRSKNENQVAVLGYFCLDYVLGDFDAIVVYPQ